MRVAWTGVSAGALCAALLLSGCPATEPMVAADGGPPRALLILDPPGSELGLRYGQLAELRVRYVVSDGDPRPIPGARIRYATFDDPGGSTLASDQAITDDDGVASVRLTAGAQESTFRVRAAGENAPSAEFGVTVSRLDFVELRVELAFGGISPARTLSAFLYLDRPCAALPPAPAPPPALRVRAGQGPSTSLAFKNLLSRDYALVGRAEDAAGHLVGAGCVELRAALLPPGTSTSLPIPLAPVVASPVGRFALTTVLRPGQALRDAALAPLRALQACPLDPATAILDAVAARLPASTQQAIEAHRGASGASCRPGQIGAGASLDAQLAQLLAAGAASLGALVSDADAVGVSVRLASTLTIDLAAPGVLEGSHRAGALSFALAGQARTYPLAASPLPALEARGVPTRWDGITLAIGPHPLALGLGGFWRRAVEELVLPAHLPGAPGLSGLVSALIAPAQRGEKTGCAAVEDLLCGTVGAPGCAGLASPACAAAAEALGRALEAALASAAPDPLTLSGQAHAFDSDGDLVVDTVQAGRWSIVGPGLGPAGVGPGFDAASFFGARP